MTDQAEAPAKESLYDILGLEENASPDDIKKAYKRRSMDVHPDKRDGDESEFLKVSKAYVILSDSRSRLTYDKTGNEKETPTDANIRTQAMREIQGMMLSILDSSDDAIFFSDLPAHVLTVINANIQSAKNNITNHKKRVAKLRRFRNRFKYKSKSAQPDFIKFALESKIHEARGGIIEELGKIDVFNMMLKLLADYEYEPEIPEQQFTVRVQI
jgi:DnaJ-class molecular chaperone